MRKAKDYIVFPLDVPTAREAKRLVRLLADDVGMFKIGLELFIRSGPDLVRWVVGAGAASVFLDLKLHDIPVTVQRAMAQVAELKVQFATVHCGDSLSMLAAAVAGAAGKVHVLGVTILTSISAADIAAAGYRDPYVANLRQLVMKKAAMAKEAGCAGVVCSGEEVGAIKAKLGGGFHTVTPGIRPLDGDVAADDQSRVVTPAVAVKRGADYLVIGRPIRDAPDPLIAVRSIALQIHDALGHTTPAGGAIRRNGG